MASSSLFFLCICLALSSVLSALTNAPCLHNPEVSALLALRNAIVSDPFSILSTWLLPSAANCSNTSAVAPCSGWTGVSCESNHVVALNLSSWQLGGNVSASLGQLPFLRSLDLSGNQLSGSIPMELGNCSSLIRLDLSVNMLEGEIPSELGRLNKLQLLNLSENVLSGAVPVSLGNCALGNCSSLIWLDLSANMLVGEIPSELGNCSSLIWLHLSANVLVGEIPSELGRLNKLQFLSLSENALAGAVPVALGNCTALTDVYLSNNSLTGELVNALGNCSSLTWLDLSANMLVGEIPSALGNCSSLIWLNLSANVLVGEIPSELGRLNKLQFLNLSDNALSGAVPVAFGNCTALTDVYLSHNSLTGEIPAVLANCTALIHIQLGYNYLTGVDPHIFKNLNSPRTIDFSNNHLSGSVPESLGTLSGLGYLSLSYNNLRGQVPPSLGWLQQLYFLDFSHNELSGVLPSSLGWSQQLNFLDFSHNELSGGFPLGLGNALQLQSLNLSHNNFTGTLPSIVTGFPNLFWMDISDNQFEGSVPDAFLSDIRAVVDLGGNPLLCGPIVNRRCDVIDQGRERLIVSVAIASILVGLLILGVVVWRHRGHRSQHLLNDALETNHIRVSAEELRGATDGFSDANVLGRGAVSSVYKGILVGRDVPVAVKLLKTDHLAQAITEAQVALLKREVALLAMVRHRNVVKVLGCCFNLETQAIILELMPNGNLDTYLHGTLRQNAPSKKEKLRLLCGIAEGLEHLHHWHDPGRSIVHCDVKPANILLDEDWEPRIADFGIAKLLVHARDDVLAEQSASLSLILRGSVGYIPPEYAFLAKVSTAGDVYSFGVVMLEVLIGKRPTDVANESDGGHETLQSLVKAAYPHQLLTLFDGTAGLTVDEAAALARMGLSCTSQHPRQRPTMLSVARFFRNMTNPLSPHPYPTLSQLAE